MSVRFTAWFSERERAEIDKAATREASSANFIVRRAVRQYLGIDKRGQLSHLSQVTTGEGEDRRVSSSS